MRLNPNFVTSRRISHVAILGILAVFTGWIRYKTLEPIEGGSDAIAHWYFVRQWFHGIVFSSLTWDHHMARFGINLPIFFVQALLGTAPTNYYVVPGSACIVAVLFTYLTAANLAGRAAGVLAAVCLAILPGMERAGSQLLPGVFTAAYLAVAAYASVKYWHGPGQGKRWMFLCSGAIFFAYLSHEPSVFFVPGFVYAFWCRDRKWKPALAFSGSLVGLLLLETLAYKLFSHQASRIGVVLLQHQPGYVSGELAGGEHDFWALFGRYDRRLQTSWKLLIFSFLTSGAGVFAYGPTRARGLILGGAGFLFGVTFSVGQIHPLMTWLNFQSRYLMPIAPVAVICGGVVVTGAFARAFHGVRRYLVHRDFFAAAFALSVAGGLAGIYEYGLKGRLPVTSAWLETQRQASAYVSAFDRGVPFVGGGESPELALMYVWALYLPDKSILDGRPLPNLGDVYVKSEDGVYWFAKSAKPFKHGISRALLEKNTGCYVAAVLSGPYACLAGEPNLAAECPLSRFNADG